MGFGERLLGAAGLSDNYDDDAAKASIAQANQQQTQAYNNYDTQQLGYQNQNRQIAGTNYFGNADQVYGQQQQAAQMLQNQANGIAPSAAQIQMGIGLGQANQQAQASALSQQGGVLSGNTQRNMLNAQAMNGQNLIGQLAAQRATDQNNAQNNYASLLSNMQAGQQNLGDARLKQQQNALQFGANLSQQNFQNADSTSGAQYQRGVDYRNAQSGRDQGVSQGIGAMAQKAGQMLAFA